MATGDMYTLEGRQVIRTHSISVCADAMKNNRVATSVIRDNIRISTVFLGIDHQHGNGPPLLFETMVFGGIRDRECHRYSTWDEAERGHNRVVKELTDFYKEYYRLNNEKKNEDIKDPCSSRSRQLMIILKD